MTNTVVRPLARQDAAAIVEMVRELAVFENEPAESVKLSEADILRDGFSEPRRFEAMVAEVPGEPGGALAGFALYFHNYSTWEGRPGIYIEDLYVREAARGHGVGRALLAAVARQARQRGYPRLDLSVLHWNPAREFYQRLGFRHMEGWLPYRLDGQALADLAG